MHEQEQKTGKIKEKITKASFFAYNHPIIGSFLASAVAVEQASGGNVLGATLAGLTAVTGAAIEVYKYNETTLDKRLQDAKQRLQDINELSLGDLESKNTEGFEISSSKAPIILENFLGIKISQKPKKIEMNEENVTVLRRKEPMASDLVIKKFEEGVNGLYSPSYNAYFARRLSNPWEEIARDLHETMHSYVKQVNPSLSEIGEKENNSKEMEKRLAYSCLDEGMSEWAAIVSLCLFTSLTFKNISSNELSNAVKEEFQPPSEQEIETPEEKNINKYRVGGYYSRIGTNILIESGMNLNQAIDTLIKNPPDTIYDLTHPEEFVRNNIQNKGKIEN